MATFNVSVPIEDWNRAVELSELVGSPSKLVQFLLLYYIEQQEKELEYLKSYRENH